MVQDGLDIHLGDWQQLWASGSECEPWRVVESGRVVVVVDFGGFWCIEEEESRFPQKLLEE